MIDTLFPEGYGEFADPNLAAAAVHRRFMDDQKLRDAVSRAVQDSADLGVAVAVDTLEGVGFGFDYTLANTAARDWALTYTDDILRQLATTTERGVGQAVARWVDNGEPLSKLVDDLGIFFDKKRAERVAATEVTRAFAEGNRIAYRESGVVGYWEWRTANDEIVCPTCGALNGKRVGLIEGDWRGHLPDELAARSRPITAPPAHVNCRCWAVPVIEDVRQ